MSNSPTNIKDGNGRLSDNIKVFNPSTGKELNQVSCNKDLVNEDDFVFDETQNIIYLNPNIPYFNITAIR